MTTGDAGMRAALTLDVLVRLDPGGRRCPATRGRATPGADLTAAEDVELAPGERAIVRTGIAIALPDRLRGVRAPAVRAGREARGHPGQCARHHRRRVPWRDQGDPAEHRPDQAGFAAPRRPHRAAGGAAGGTREFPRGAGPAGSARGEDGFGSTGGHAADYPLRPCPRGYRGLNGRRCAVFGRRRNAGDRDRDLEQTRRRTRPTEAAATRPARARPGRPARGTRPSRTRSCPGSTSAAFRSRCWRERTSSWCSPSSTAPG